MRTLPFFAAVALIAACTSIQEIRQSEPIRSGAFEAGYKDMAACVVYETADRYTVASAVFEREGKAILSHASEIGGPLGVVRNPMWEMTIAEDRAAAKSLVEFRTARVLDGGARWAEEIWPVVDKCARTVAVHLSPPVQR